MCYASFQFHHAEASRNYSFGINEQIVFPEIDYDKVDALRGMDVTITTSARTDEEAEALLREFNFPLRTQ